MLLLTKDGSPEISSSSRSGFAVSGSEQIAHQLAQWARGPISDLDAFIPDPYWIARCARGHPLTRSVAFTIRKKNGSRWLGCRLCWGRPARGHEGLQERL